MSDLEMLQPDGTWKKIGTVDLASVKALEAELFETETPGPKHTPGPWVLDDNEVAPSSEPANLIAHVYAVDRQTKHVWFWGEQSKANARLIAQAPTLLADLTDAAAQLRKYETLHRAKGTPDSPEKAEVNAALAARFEATIAAAVGGAE